MEKIETYEDLKDFLNDKFDDFVFGIESFSLDTFKKNLSTIEFKTIDEFDGFGWEEYFDEFYVNIEGNYQYNFDKEFHKQLDDFATIDLIKNCLYNTPNKAGKIYNQAKSEMREEKEAELKHYIYFLDDLFDYDDKIGDITKIECSVDLDYEDRDAPVAYLDGDVLVGGKSESHTETIKTYYGLSSDEDFFRLSEDELNEFGFKDIAFGHLYKDMVFIDAYCGNVQEKVVADAFKGEIGVDKVYFLDKSENFVTRLAKNIKD